VSARRAGDASHRQVMQVGFGQPLIEKLRDQFFQRLPMQRVEDHVAMLGMLAYLSIKRIDGAPAVNERGPVGLDAALLRPFRKIVDQAGGQSTQVPNTSNTRAFTAEISDISAPSFAVRRLLPSSSFRDAPLAQARNP